MNKELTVKYIDTDFLVMGGGTAGCYAALTAADNSDAHILIVEKANIERSGCLAAGVNALNAYIAPGRSADDYVGYATNDAAGIAREDLLLTMSLRLNSVTKRLEELGLVILKDETGGYAARGRWNIKINGENIKPILAGAVSSRERIKVLERVNVIGYIVRENRFYGAYAIDSNGYTLYVIRARAGLCATGGASGLYRPNNPGFSRHKMWYPPFNAGAGYAMGIRAGAEMTSFEMRFVALRCKDTIAPTGALAQGLNAPQVNSRGELYEAKYGFRTFERVYGVLAETREGRGPCFLKTSGASDEQKESLKRAYLNMAPAQTLKWVENGFGDVELCGSEPYITGGHTASGYWVSAERETTIRGLFAAGDVSGGCPQKYVTGALAEGEIAALAALRRVNCEFGEIETGEETAKIKKGLEEYLNREMDLYSADELKQAMQAAMDVYAGGSGRDYSYNEAGLRIALEKINLIEELCARLKADDMAGLVEIHELLDRLTVAKSVIAHLSARHETRWNGFGNFTDYPETDEKWNKYVNSRFVNGELRVFTRKLTGRREADERKD
jgi:adenylylsulfate reductase subunit A